MRAHCSFNSVSCMTACTSAFTRVGVNMSRVDLCLHCVCVCVCVCVSVCVHAHASLSICVCACMRTCAECST